MQYCERYASIDLPIDEALKEEAYWLYQATSKTPAIKRFATSDEGGLQNDRLHRCVVSWTCLCPLQGIVAACRLRVDSDAAQLLVVQKLAAEVTRARECQVGCLSSDEPRCLSWPSRGYPRRSVLSTQHHLVLLLHLPAVRPQARKAIATSRYV